MFDVHALLSRAASYPVEVVPSSRDRVGHRPGEVPGEPKGGWALPEAVTVNVVQLPQPAAQSGPHDSRCPVAGSVILAARTEREGTGDPGRPTPQEAKPQYKQDVALGDILPIHRCPGCTVLMLTAASGDDLSTFLRRAALARALADTFTTASHRPPTAPADAAAAVPARLLPVAAALAAWLPHACRQPGVDRYAGWGPAARGAASALREMVAARAGDTVEAWFAAQGAVVGSAACEGLPEGLVATWGTWPRWTDRDEPDWALRHAWEGAWKHAGDPEAAVRLCASLLPPSPGAARGAAAEHAEQCLRRWRQELRDKRAALAAPVMELTWQPCRERQGPWGREDLEALWEQVRFLAPVAPPETDGSLRGHGRAPVALLAHHYSRQIETDRLGEFRTDPLRLQVRDDVPLIQVSGEVASIGPR